MKNLIKHYWSTLECLIKKFDRCKNNPESLFTANVGKHISSGSLMSTMSSFRSKEKKDDVYRGKYYIEKFCEPLKEHAMEMINFKKKKNKVINNRAEGII